jgi:hypothetical protein
VPQLIAEVTQKDIEKKTLHRVFLFGGAGMGALGVLSLGGSAAFFVSAERGQDGLTDAFTQSELASKQVTLDSRKKNSFLFARAAAGLFIGGTVSATIGLIKKSKTQPKQETTGVSQ